MKPIFELSRFADGRIMLRVRFFRNSNFWIHDLESASWVPTTDEASNLKEFLDLVNERNEIKRALGETSRERGA